MAAPTGIFVGLDLSTLREMQATLASGNDISSVSGGGIATTFATLSAEQKAVEVAYALRIAIANAQGRKAPARVHVTSRSNTSL